MPANQRETMTRLTLTALCSVLIFALGCAKEDQNALLVTGNDSVVAVAPLAIPAFENPPTGSAIANKLELVSFDPAALDAFGRTTERDATSTWPYWNYWYDAGEWSFGTVLGHEGFHTAEMDPRLPALSFTNADFAFDYFFMFLPDNDFGIGMNWFGTICCATPGAKYVIGLVRTGVTVNGELDQAQILVGDPVADPDELAPIGGTPGGDHTFPAGLFAETDAVANANPFFIGTVQACPAAPPYLPYGDTCANQGYSDGRMVIDFVIDPGSVFPTGSEPTASNSPLAPNEQTRFDLPAYNYIMIWETNPDGTPDLSSPLTRVQLGVDLSPLGGPINNAYAPFPTAALSVDELALGTGANSRADSVTLTLENLKELAGTAVYQVWAAMADGSATALDFLYTPPGGTQTAATSFNGGEGEHEVVVEFPDDATHVVVSIEGSAGASSISDVQILWSAGVQEAGMRKSTDLGLLFGTFSESRTWVISGAGSGGLFGDELRYRYEQLPRPPVGYKYVGWLASGDTMFTRLSDETFTTPPGDGYQVLTDADVDTGISDFVQPSQIVEAMTKICVTAGEQGCFDLGDYDTFFLALEPKAGIMTEPSPTRDLTGTLPAQ